MGSSGQDPSSLDLFVSLISFAQIQKFERSGRRPSSIGYVPRGGIIINNNPFYCSYDHSLRDRIDFVGRGFKPWTKQTDIFLIICANAILGDRVNFCRSRVRSPDRTV